MHFLGFYMVSQNKVCIAMWNETITHFIFMNENLTYVFLLNYSLNLFVACSTKTQAPISQIFRSKSF